MPDCRAKHSETPTYSGPWLTRVAQRAAAYQYLGLDTLAQQPRSIQVLRHQRNHIPSLLRLAGVTRPRRWTLTLRSPLPQTLSREVVPNSLRTAQGQGEARRLVEVALLPRRHESPDTTSPRGSIGRPA